MDGSTNRFEHTIEAADTPENPNWYALRICDGAEEYDGTPESYGREVLENWITDMRANGDDDPYMDEYGNPSLRVAVYSPGSIGETPLAIVEVSG